MTMKICIPPYDIMLLNFIIMYPLGGVQIVDSDGQQGIIIPVGSRLELRCVSRDGSNVTWYHNGVMAEENVRTTVKELVDYLQVR